jgi:ATP-independent RNA helicase DbpA
MIEEYLQRLDIKELKPMQVDAIRQIKPGKNIILLSPTGSGKTLAFILPLLKMLNKEVDKVQAVIISPARELALQIESIFKTLQSGFKINACYGGHPITTELNNLSSPPAVIVGTPGRISDHIRRKSFDTSVVSVLIIDEFDKSLELGFEDEMSFIIRNLNGVKTNILTSATPAVEIPDFIKLENPIIVDYTDSTNAKNQLEKKWLRIAGTDKLALLYILICHLGNESSVVFCNHREVVERISSLLNDKDISHGIFHGGMEQDKRELSLIKFRNGSHHILLTTDLASRGLDIPEIRNVIHYQLPVSVTAWTHRNGRTARMDKHGRVWLLLTENDYIPEFIEERIDEEVVNTDCEPPLPEQWETIYVSLGKKDKISKTDIVGFLMQQGKMKKDEIGRIEVLDYASFVAIKRDKALTMVRTVRGIPLKRKVVKIQIAKI